MSLRTLLFALFAFCITGQSTSYDVDVAGDQQFTDTHVDVKAGETLKFTATGTLQLLSPARKIGPAGISRGWADVIRTYPVLEGNKYALVGRVGSHESARAFLIGPSAEHRVAIDGRLYLGINMLAPGRVDGVFHVHIEHTPAPRGWADVNVSFMTQEELDSIPTRVNDRQGNLILAIA